MLRILFVGLAVALIEIKDKGNEVEQENAHIEHLSTQQQKPKFDWITQRHLEGPWPECLKLSGEGCQMLLHVYTNWQNGLDIEVVSEENKVEEDFDESRVRIYVDESNKVTAIPQRG